MNRSQHQCQERLHDCYETYQTACCPEKGCIYELREKLHRLGNQTFQSQVKEKTRKGGGGELVFMLQSPVNERYVVAKQ
jgi:hypothetical protein